MPRRVRSREAQRSEVSRVQPTTRRLRGVAPYGASQGCVSPGTVEVAT